MNVHFHFDQNFQMKKIGIQIMKKLNNLFNLLVQMKGLLFNYILIILYQYIIIHYIYKDVFH